MIESCPILSMCSIVILAHNREDQIWATLDNLKTETINTGIEIIIVDNASSDKTKKYIDDALFGWVGATLIRCQRNVGIAEGRNIGWKNATREFIISIDDDIVISLVTIEKMIKFSLLTPNFGVLSPTIVDSKTDCALNGGIVDEVEIKSFYEACFLIPRVVIAKIGYMDTLLATAGEGLDFSLRMRRANLPIIRLYDVVVYHFDRPRRAEDNELRRLTWMWSFARVYWKNYSPVLAFLLTLRNYISHIRKGLPLYGLGFAAALLRTSFSGAVSGRRSRRIECHLK